MTEGRGWSGLALRCRAGWAVVGALGVGCGAPEPAVLPAAAPSAWVVVTSKTNPASAQASAQVSLEDRALGRSGLACADCHAIRAGAVRPAPRLDGALTRDSLWSGATPNVAVALNLCVERYLDRPALAPPMLDALVSALTALPALSDDVRGSAPVDGARLYDTACRHCHEDGPAGGVLATRWTRDAITAVVRGSNRPAHPATHMPAFDAQTLPEPALTALVDFVVDASTRAR